MNNYKAKMDCEMNKFIIHFWLTPYENKYGSILYKHIVLLNKYFNKHNYKKQIEDEVINDFMTIQGIMISENNLDIIHIINFRELFKKILLLNRNFNLVEDYSINYSKIKTFYTKLFNEITDVNFLTEIEIKKILKEI